MRRIVVIVAAVAAALSITGPAVAAQSAKVAALQIALRANGLYTGEVDGISGPMTRSAIVRFQRRNGIRATGKVGYLTRCKLGPLGKPLLGQRELRRGRVGWDVASLEFRLRSFGLPAAKLDGRFDASTAAALKRFQRARGLDPDGIAGGRTFRALARGKSSGRRRSCGDPHGATGRGLRGDRTPVPRERGTARACQRPPPDERHHARAAAPGARPCRDAAPDGAAPRVVPHRAAG